MKIKYLSVFIVLFLGLHSYPIKSQNTVTIHENIQQQVDDIFEDLVNIRRDLHMHPELSGEEKRTSEKIEEHLLSLGLEVKKNIGGYGVVGILNGHKKGKKIAWRTDIDALSSDIPDVVDFKSKNMGIRHICGHDVHTTIALGIAKVLSNQKENLRGTIYFIFQPSEENYQGAKAMINDGLFDIINPNEIYALHITAFPKGLIATKSKNPFSYTNRIKVQFKNSKNKNSKIDFIKNLISSFQNIEPDSKFWNSENLGDPQLGLDSPNTIYKNYITVNPNFEIKQSGMQISVSTAVNSSNKKQLDTLLDSITTKIELSEYGNDLISIKYTYEKATVMNNEVLTKKTMTSISNIYGASNVIPLHGTVPGDIGDDFAYFQNKIPGVYFFLGGSNFEGGIISDPHSPKFAVDEESIKFGVKYFSSMIVERLKK